MRITQNPYCQMNITFIKLSVLSSLIISSAACLATETYQEENPHAIASPEWERYENCRAAAALTQTSAESIVHLKGYSVEQKKQSIIDTMGREPIIENSVSSLLDQKHIEFALQHEGNGKKAFDASWQYCMDFSLKEHYYKDDLLSDVPDLDDL